MAHIKKAMGIWNKALKDWDEGKISTDRKSVV